MKIIQREKHCVGDRVYKARKEIGISMAKMGEYAGVKRQSVNSWEKGKSLPDWFSLENLKKNISLNPEWIMTGRGPMFLDGDVEKIIAMTQSNGFDTRQALDYLAYLSERQQAGNQ